MFAATHGGSVWFDIMPTWLYFYVWPHLLFGTHFFFNLDPWKVSCYNDVEWTYIEVQQQKGAGLFSFKLKEKSKEEGEEEGEKGIGIAEPILGGGFKHLFIFTPTVGKWFSLTI